VGRAAGTRSPTSASRYLRLDPARSSGFVRAATALLDAGADANTGFFFGEHQPGPSFESVLYGAAGVARNPQVTHLLLERGADPNDGETAYHAPEGFDDRALRLIVQSGRLAAPGLTTMLHRKLDWTDQAGAAWLLEHGADPDDVSHWGDRALHHALGRGNSVALLELLLEHGADPTLPAPRWDGLSAVALAARLGRGDALHRFELRGVPVELDGDLAFLATCARGEAARAYAIAAGDLALVGRVQQQVPGLVDAFAGSGNTAGLRILLELGCELPDSALHVAVWRERVETVRLLVERGAPLEARDASGATPLAVAVRALVEVSDFTPHASPSIASLLLAAGARPESVGRPTGSSVADELLARRTREA
jgi:ankyrin repeat protein